MDGTVVGTGDNHRAQAHPKGPEAAAIGNLALVQQVDPGAAEDVGHLRLEHRRVDVRRTMHAIVVGDQMCVAVPYADLIPPERTVRAHDSLLTAFA